MQQGAPHPGGPCFFWWGAWLVRRLVGRRLSEYPYDCPSSANEGSRNANVLLMIANEC